MNGPKLLDRVRSVARLRHLSPRTEGAYSDCIKRFVLFHGKRHPSEMGAEENRLLLPHMAKVCRGIVTMRQQFADSYYTILLRSSKLDSV